MARTKHSAIVRTGGAAGPSKAKKPSGSAGACPHLKSFPHRAIFFLHTLLCVDPGARLCHVLPRLSSQMMEL
jgi:hypothetical protein